jgi:hypothetical protein
MENDKGSRLYTRSSEPTERGVTSTGSMGEVAARESTRRFTLRHRLDAGACLGRLGDVEDETLCGICHVAFESQILPDPTSA